MPKLPLDEQESIRGCQYTSRKFRRLGARVGLTQSMGATGVCWDKSWCTRCTWATRAVMRLAVARWIEGWYNSRRHSSLHYFTPIEKGTTHDESRPAA
jgi:putative transposase